MSHAVRTRPTDRPAWLPGPAPDTPVAVGLSGGVDSSLAAALLCDTGAPVRALFMKNWEEDDADGCSAAEDLAAARAVAACLGIELGTVNFATEYWDRVFETFLAELRAGRTPNPDVLCNREIKFREFREHALRLGAGRVATGHYARLRHDCDGVRLLRAVDEGKDQTYFLHAVEQAALADAVFPLGHLTKDAVRAEARARGLPTHARKDSTGICFIGERPFRDFLARYLPANPGPIVDLHGRRVGEHIGVQFYTLGQRKGLGIGGRAGDGGDPWYVYAKDIASNTLHVVRGGDHPLLYRGSLVTGAFHCIHGELPAAPFRALVRTRHRQPLQPCTAQRLEAGRVHIDLDRPQRAITAGQSAVLYRGEECIGGGVIQACASDAAMDRAP